MKNLLFASLFSLFLINGMAQMQPNGQLDDFGELVTRYTVPFPMPDGTNLAADIYLPVTRDSLMITIDIPNLEEVRVEIIPKGSQYIIYDSINGEPNPHPWQLPVVMTRTPYNKNTDTLMGQFLASLGYAVIIQDMRGRYESEGVYLPMYSDAWGKNSYHPDIQHLLDITSWTDVSNGNKHEDGYNSIRYINDSLRRNYEGEDFLLSIGNIGMFGASAMGNSQYQLASVQAIHPEERGLKCLFPMVATNEHYKSTGVQHGVFRESLVKGWIANQFLDGLETANIDDDISLHNNYHTLHDYGAIHIDEVIDRGVDYLVVEQFHGNPSGYYPNSPTRVDMDASLAFLNEDGHPDSSGTLSRYTNLEVPVYHLTGWWDIFVDGQIETYNNILNHISDDHEHKKLQKLVIGPWAHQTIGTKTTGDITFPDNVNDFFVDIDQIEHVQSNYNALEELLNSELYQWFRANLNHHPYNRIGDPEVIIRESEKWQEVNTFLKVRIPSEDYTISMTDFLNFAAGFTVLAGFPYQTDVNGEISSNTIDVPAMDPPLFEVNEPVNMSQVIDFREIPDVRLYVAGNYRESNPYGNYWIKADSFPFYKDIREYKMFLHPDFSLSEEMPDETGASISYIHDPDNPVATLGGGNMLVRTPVDDRKSQGPINYAHDMYRPYVLDRPDVLSFTSPPIADSLRIVGYPEATLFASSSPVDNETDSVNMDLFVRILDVYPDGRAYFVVEGAVNSMARDYAKELANGKENIHIPFRNIMADEVYEYTFQLLPIAYTFGANHRIKVLISSSNYPRYQSNSSIPVRPGSFFRREPMDGKKYFNGTDTISPFQLQQNIYASMEYLSHITFPVFSGTNFLDVDDRLAQGSDNEPFVIYPNPANTEVFIFSRNLQCIHYTVFDMYGKKILSGDANGLGKMDMTGLPGGMYIIQIQDKTGRKEVEKLIIRH